MKSRITTSDTVPIDSFNAGESKTGSTNEWIYDQFSSGDLSPDPDPLYHFQMLNPSSKVKSSYAFDCTPKGNRWTLHGRKLKLSDLHKVIEFLKKHREITVLDLNNCDFDQECVNFLSEQLANTNVTNLNLTRCDIDDKDAIALSNNRNFKELYLGCNKITSNGAKALSTLPKLSVLNLINNQITDEGIIPFANSKTLISFYIHCNQITDLGAKALLQNRSFVDKFSFIAQYNASENKLIGNEYQKLLGMLVQENIKLNLAKAKMREAFEEDHLLPSDLTNIIAMYMDHDLFSEENPLPDPQSDTTLTPKVTFK